MAFSCNMFCQGFSVLIEKVIHKNCNIFIIKKLNTSSEAYRKSGTETLGWEPGPRTLGWKPRVGSWSGTLEWDSHICFYNILNHIVFFIRHQKASIWIISSILKWGKYLLFLIKTIFPEHLFSKFLFEKLMFFSRWTYNQKQSCPGLLCKKGILKIFPKFTGTLVLESFLFKKRLWHRCFPVNFAKFLRISIFIEQNVNTFSR